MHIIFYLVDRQVEIVPTIYVIELMEFKSYFERKLWWIELYSWGCSDLSDGGVTDSFGKTGHPFIVVLTGLITLMPFFM